MKRHLWFVFLFIVAVFASVVAGQSEFPQTYTITTSARARACATSTTSCAIVTTFRRGTLITVTDIVEGVRVSGSTEWLRVSWGEETVYVHSSLATEGVITTTSTNRQATTAPVQPRATSALAANVPISTPVPAAPAAVGSPYACNGRNDLNCGDFANWAQANAHFQACGDEDGLDGDNDGLVCESMR